jgi:hypothetical protein
MPPSRADIPALAAEFTAAHPSLDPDQQRRALAALRLLGEGRPSRPGSWRSAPTATPRTSPRSPGPGWRSATSTGGWSRSAA